MPKKIKRPCRQAGCAEVTHNGWCAEHKKKSESVRHKEQDAKRGTAAQRGYDARWRKFRLSYLSRHPLCVHCYGKGQVVSATVIDHITPFKGSDSLQYDLKNLQALCKPCHDHKTATIDSAFARSSHAVE